MLTTRAGDDHDSRRRVDDLKAHGHDAVSFQSLESAMQWWRDAGPHGAGAALAYVDTNRSWIAVGRPLIEPGLQPAAARRFMRDARAANRRPIFFGVESVEPFGDCPRLMLGRQSVLGPARWKATLGASHKLREQLRRARAKGVIVRVAAASELEQGTRLRADVERLKTEWLESRHMDPMGFLVAVEPFHAPGEHVYIVAERRGTPVQFLSAVPIYTRRGWLVEDMLRGPDAPNGTTELVLDRLMQEIGDDGAWITPGLTPLAGLMPLWLRVARATMAPLYDFRGLERFRARLSPERWDPVWVVWDRGAAPRVIIDVLRAFADGPLTTFAVRSIVRHPSGPPWAVAVPLVGWTALLAALLASGRSALLGFHPAALFGWIVFDAVMAWLLFRAAIRPRLGRLGLAAAFAAFDLVLSVQHLARVGLSADPLAAALRLPATLGPAVGVTALVWAMYRAFRIRAGGRRV